MNALVDAPPPRAAGGGISISDRYRSVKDNRPYRSWVPRDLEAAGLGS